jgi:hypothetical protein
MKKIKYPIFALILIVISVTVIYLLPKSLNSQLDDLEAIIDRYEPIFSNTPYGTQQYTDMITEYNKEIFGWAEKFESDRYVRDKEGKALRNEKGGHVLNPEFKEVEKRFYDLNNRMTDMVLSNIPPQKKLENER